MSGESRQDRRGVAAFIVVHTARRANRISTLVYMRLRFRSLYLSLCYHFFVCVQPRAIGLALRVCTDWCVDASRSLIEPLFLSSFTDLGRFNAISLCASDDLFRQTGNAFRSRYIALPTTAIHRHTAFATATESCQALRSTHYHLGIASRKTHQHGHSFPVC